MVQSDNATEPYVVRPPRPVDYVGVLDITWPRQQMSVPSALCAKAFARSMSPGFSCAAQAGNHRFLLLSALRAHTKAP